MSNYNLEDRTLLFSKKIINLIRNTKASRLNMRICDQLIRSGTSVGANYREANETVTPKDFKNRVRIAKKEAKETVYWLELLEHIEGQNEDITYLINESKEFIKILATIHDKWKT